MRVIPREVVRRKTITWSNKIRILQKRLALTSFQKEILIGTILGDGCLAVNAHGRNFRLHVEHMAKHHTYVQWKYQIFKEWTLSPPIFLDRTNSWKFRTISHPSFTELHKMFYRDRKKIIPEEIDNLLKSSLSLAVWFMDDGALGPHKKGLTLNTQSFSKKDNQKLMNCLKKNFQLNVTLHRDKNNWRIYILPSSTTQFRELTGKLILPEFKYKISY